jgi:hypothetical protein
VTPLMNCHGQPRSSTEAARKCTCTRCGWSWIPRSKSADPPRACARCRTSYWQTAPTSARGNTPDNPKWGAQREWVEERKGARRLARLRSRAAELGFRLVAVNCPSIRTRVPERQPTVGVPADSIRFAEPEPTEGPAAPPAPPSAPPVWRKTWSDS